MIRELKVGIVNYGCGNISSLQSSLKLIGHRSKLINNNGDFNSSKIIIIPGVGAFPNAMNQINQRRLIDGIQMSAKENKLIIGICLGMHLLAEMSYEFRKTRGLGLIKGIVDKHPNGLQVGWMTSQIKRGNNFLKKFDKKDFYHNHSYILNTEEKNIVFKTNSLGTNYPSIIKNNNIIGIQFHPEKSQTNGLKLLSTLLKEYPNV